MAFKGGIVISRKIIFQSLFLFLNHHIIATFDDKYNGKASIHGKYM